MRKQVMSLNDEFKILTWEYFGEELKRFRETAGLTQQALGDMVYVSASYIAQFESGKRKPQLDVSERLDNVPHTGGVLVRMVKKLVQTSKQFADFFGLMREAEQKATSIHEYENVRLPGVLQTRPYAEAIIRAMHPLSEEQVVTDLVDGRMNRATILEGPARPAYWLVLHETALHTRIGGDDVMRGQLEHVLRLIDLNVIGVQVLPFTEGAVGAMVSPILLLEFADLPSIVYTEGLSSADITDDPRAYRQAEEVYALLRTAALPISASRELIESRAEKYF
ncbi:xre family toxin-antitoxin system, antitoxin component [Streptomyces sp. SPB074]|nr:xre family toxin-antitoxin system, antitoxin component [Streptomyces sp. SPB074]